MFKTNEIRSKFLDYFASNEHQIIRSSSLVPHNDPTLMFTNSGMVQFKNIFTGAEEAKFKCATSSQKSVRAGGKHNDLDNVGYTARHHTFFEMLGNFSFGAYFKEEAIFYAWNFLTKELMLPKEKLYVTVFHEDEDAANFWKKIASLGDDRIIRIKTTDNFWSMGDTGPCGPCSEIFYDHGESVWGGLPGTKDENGDRYIEIWNLVFMQYEQLENGSRVPLPKPCIDTGMGLERLAAVLQNVHNNYEIDLFKNIIEYTSDTAKILLTEQNITSFRVIADHLRSSAFLIADGVMPSNEGRGYVLRRIMRRAMRHIHQIGSNDILMYKLLNSLISEMGAAYHELSRAEALIKETLYQEENKFRTTLAKGLKLLDDSKVKINKGVLPGNVAFKLYDTYGFPLDLTVDILKNQEITVDLEGFNLEMLKQKEMARAAWKGSGEKVTEQIWFDILDKNGATEFVGYENTICEAIILAKIEAEDNDIIITNQTPFYAESGGQLGDIGFIETTDLKQIKVLDTKKFLGKIHAHILEKNSLKIGDIIKLEIDKAHRQDIKRNHSATHLLQYVLRKTLGEHVVQKGSLVAGHHLRFDFAHNKALSMEEMEMIELEVNRLIMANHSTSTILMDLEEASKSGAMALFGEKYDEEVRVIRMGDSVELCGGTHVSNTGDIGLFKVKSEMSIASGVRRIEAVTGEHAIRYIQEKNSQLSRLAEMLKVGTKEIAGKIEAMNQERKKLEKKLKDLKQKMISGDSSAEKIEQIGKIKLIFRIAEDISPQDLRDYVDNKRNDPNSIIFAASVFDGKTSLIVAVGKNSQAFFIATELARNACVKAGGAGGGGRNDIAQAGGFNFNNINLAEDYIRDEITNICKKK